MNQGNRASCLCPLPTELHLMIMKALGGPSHLASLLMACPVAWRCYVANQRFLVDPMHELEELAWGKSMLPEAITIVRLRLINKSFTGNSDAERAAHAANLVRFTRESLQGVRGYPAWPRSIMRLAQLANLLREIDSIHSRMKDPTERPHNIVIPILISGDDVMRSRFGILWFEIFCYTTARYRDYLEDETAELLEETLNSDIRRRISEVLSHGGCSLEMRRIIEFSYVYLKDCLRQASQHVIGIENVPDQTKLTDRILTRHPFRDLREALEDYDVVKNSAKVTSDRRDVRRTIRSFESISKLHLNSQYDILAKAKLGLQLSDEENTSLSLSIVSLVQNVDLFPYRSYIFREGHPSSKRKLIAVASINSLAERDKWNRADEFNWIWEMLTKGLYTISLILQMSQPDRKQWALRTFNKVAPEKGYRLVKGFIDEKFFFREA